MRIDASKIIFTGHAIIVLVSSKILGCNPSGPGDLYIFSLSRALKILYSLNSISGNDISDYDCVNLHNSKAGVC